MNDVSIELAERLCTRYNVTKCENMHYQLKKIIWRVKNIFDWGI